MKKAIASPKGKRRDETVAVVADFEIGMSCYQVATKWGLRIATVEDAIRRAMIAREGRS